MISVFGLHMQHPRAKRSWVVPRRTGPIAREEVERRGTGANANVARPRRAEETKGASGSGSGSGSSKA